MEGPGPDVKRPRHHYEPPRLSSQQQHHPPPITTAHGNAGILPNPGSYSSSSQHQPPPPSPFHDVTNDCRSLPDPHTFVGQTSGQSTPRDTRFQQQDLIYSRRGSAVGTPRSPDDYHQYPPPRSMSVTTIGDGQHYPAPFTPDPAAHAPAYPPSDPHANGNVHHGLPIHGYGEAGHTLSQGPPVEYSQSPVTGGAHPFGAMQYGNSLSQTGLRPKKGNRATQACDVCRTRKAKCDEGRPKCGFCTETDSLCNYQSVAPAKVDRANQQIMDQITAQQDDIKQLKKEVGGKLEQIEQLLLKLSGTSRPLDLTTEEAETKPSLAQLESPSNRLALAAQTVANVLPSPGAKDHKLVDSSPNGSFNTVVTDSSGSDVLASIARQNEIHAEHHTAAQKLFRWPSIKALLQRCKDLKFTETSENYFMRYETQQGIMRLYGRGRSIDEPREAQPSASVSSPATSQTSAPSEDSSETSTSVSSTDGAWGYGFNITVGEPRPEPSNGGLNPDNSLKLDPKTISNHLQCYLENMQIMHPILDEQSLVKTVEKFKRRYNPSSDQSIKAGFLPPMNGNFDTIRKRKHSDGQYYNAGTETGLAESPMIPKPLLEWSPTTAMVLLVLALGKICGHNRPLPGLVSARDHSKEPTGSMAYGFTNSPPLNSMKMSPSPSSQSASASSPLNVVRSVHWSGRPGGEHQRNLDVIPGLAYYAQATAILGTLAGSHELEYIQCCLLAGLYAGQLAQSIESLVWIQNAARACQLLLRGPTISIQDLHPTRQNLIRLAFYSALQLESDIRAEVDMPSSGIESFQPVPDKPTSDPQTLLQEGQIMPFYSFQLHIRKILNDVQQEVYREGRDLNQTVKRTSMRNALDENLTEWRRTLIQELQWDDDELPTRFINHARLHGKYYGAQYIIHRPFLHYALDLDANGGLDNFMASNQGGAMPPPKTATDPYLNEVIASAKITVKAAILSTTAFDGIIKMRRLIVTNIVGTAHAQFGNMLVLSAVYKSKHLKQFIISPDVTETPKQIMRRLFARTISVLADLKAISKTLGHDQFILSRLKDVVFEGEDDESEDGQAPEANSSFIAN